MKLSQTIAIPVLVCTLLLGGCSSMGALMGAPYKKDSVDRFHSSASNLRRTMVETKDSLRQIRHKLGRNLSGGGPPPPQAITAYANQVNGLARNIKTTVSSISSLLSSGKRMITQAPSLYMGKNAIHLPRKLKLIKQAVSWLTKLPDQAKSVGSEVASLGRCFAGLRRGSVPSACRSSGDSSGSMVAHSTAPGRTHDASSRSRTLSAVDTSKRSARASKQFEQAQQWQLFLDTIDFLLSKKKLAMASALLKPAVLKNQTDPALLIRLAHLFALDKDWANAQRILHIVRLHAPGWIAATPSAQQVRRIVNQSHRPSEPSVLRIQFVNAGSKVPDSFSTPFEDLFQWSATKKSASPSSLATQYAFLLRKSANTAPMVKPTKLGGTILYSVSLAHNEGTRTVWMAKDLPGCETNGARPRIALKPGTVKTITMICKKPTTIAAKDAGAALEPDTTAPVAKPPVPRTILPKQWQGLIGPRLPLLKRCQPLKNTPSLHFRLRFRVQMDGSVDSVRVFRRQMHGSVDSVRVKLTSRQMAAVRGCIKKAVEKWKFPAIIRPVTLKKTLLL